MMQPHANGNVVRMVVCILLLATALCGCGSESPAPDQKFITEQDAALISVAREAALAQGWTLEDCIYSVRREGSGWVVVVDRAPGYKGEGEPSVVVDGGFVVSIDAQSRATQIVSFSKTIDLALPAATSSSQ